MGWIENRFEKNFLVTTVDYVFNWARKSAIWPMTFGLACCAIEMIASSTSRFDIARFGSEVFRPSPRQLVKFGYTVQQGAAYPGALGNTAAIEFVTSFRAFSFTPR